MSRGHAPKFAKRYAELGDAIVAATRRYVDEVRSGAFPSAEQSYKPNRADESGPRAALSSTKPPRKLTRAQLLLPSLIVNAERVVPPKELAPESVSELSFFT